MNRIVSDYLTYVSTLLVFLTILAGGVVHATGSGLACPDWPLCFGKVFPRMEGAVLLEHSHRLIAGITGIFVWLTGIWNGLASYRTRNQKWLYVSSMMLILIQAVVGGLTVLWKLPDWVSTTHFVLAQGTFAMMVILCWSVLEQTDVERRNRDGRILPEGYRWVGGVTLFLLCVQMVVGAWLRHIGTSGAPFSFSCDRFPLCPPRWVEFTSQYFQHYYTWHRILGVLVTVSVVVMVWTFKDLKQRIPRCYRMSLMAVMAVFIQVMVGELLVRAYLAVTPVTLHLAIADFLFVVLILINLELHDPVSLRKLSP